MRVLFADDDYRITFEDSQALRDAIAEEVYKFLAEHKQWNGEGIMQSDNPQIYAPVLIADIADKLIKAKCEDIL